MMIRVNIMMMTNPLWWLGCMYDYDDQGVHDDDVRSVYDDGKGVYDDNDDDYDHD